MKEPNLNEVTLKDLIARANTNQRELSKTTGIPEITINTWVARKSVPRFDNALILARALDVSLKTLAESIGLRVENIPDDAPTADNN